MKSFFLKLSFLLLILGFFPSGIQAATDSNETWSQTPPSNYRNTSSWAASTESANSLPEIERLKRRMGEFLNQGMEDLQKKGYVQPQNDMRSDVVEKDGAFYLLMDIPGMKKDQISIEVKGQEVLIAGDRKVEEEFKTSNLIKVERRYGSFQRIFSIPEEFIADQISAKYENGVLQVRIPKKNDAQIVKKTIVVS